MLGGRCWLRLLLREVFLLVVLLVFGMGWIGIGGVGYIPFNFHYFILSIEYILYQY